jgi:hypothetical protein
LRMEMECSRGDDGEQRLPWIAGIHCPDDARSESELVEAEGTACETGGGHVRRVEVPVVRMASEATRDVHGRKWSRTRRLKYGEGACVPK